MNFTLLIVDKKDHYTDVEQKSLDALDKTQIYFIEDEVSLFNFISNEKINFIVYNTELYSLDILISFFENKNYDENSIPLLLVGKSFVSYNIPNIFVYDCIESSSDKTILFRKIDFCRYLYQKELKHQEEMQELLYVDNLTKLPNRAKLIKDIKDNTIGITSLGMVDLNSFKEINDFFGYRIGDMVLKKVVETIDDVIFRTEHKVLLYKFSADVYCLANIGLSDNDFEEVIVYLLGSLESKLFVIDEHEIDIRATAGITFSTKNNKLITANIALQFAKKNNKDYIVFYEALDTFQEYQNNMLWTKKLKNALEKDNIIVYFQPLVNNTTLKVDKYECLVRMIDGEKVIAPYFFLDVSKKANQYHTITKIVIEKAFQQFENLPFEFSINVSYEDIEDKNFINFIKYKLQKYNVAKRVVWEILEDEDIKSYDVLFDFIKEMKGFGCKVAIDDFGSGYSNFEHILRMDVDYLKIDASLIKYVATDQNSYKVVKTIIEFANSLNLKTIAEYVENENIFRLMQELGATYSQGYYFSPPIAKPSLTAF